MTAKRAKVRQRLTVKTFSLSRGASAAKLVYAMVRVASTGPCASQPAPDRKEESVCSAYILYMHPSISTPSIRSFHSMSFTRSLSSALYRSIDSAKHSLATALRMDVMPPTAAGHGRLLIYTLSSPEDIHAVATGCDADMGGASKMKLEIDPQEGTGRFWGTLSSEVPRNAKLERSGYAGFRNRNRPTLFGAQTWDTTMHPYVRLRVRNRLAGPPSSSNSNSPSASLRSALSSSTFDGNASTYARAVQALGLDLANGPGPKFFVNVQTDGPVTSDLFQHRLLLDESKGNAWQDVSIPLSDFILINTGEVSASQVKMMREKIRTVGISAVLEPPSLGDLESQSGQGANAGAPDVLRQQQNEEDTSSRESQATQTAAGSRRGAKYNFDLGIEKIEMLSEEALEEEQTA